MAQYEYQFLPDLTGSRVEIGPRMSRSIGGRGVEVVVGVGLVAEFSGVGEWGVPGSGAKKLRLEMKSFKDESHTERDQEEIEFHRGSDHPKELIS